MAVEFNAGKLLQVLVRNEAKVAELYTNLAAQMEVGKGANLFQLLAEDEKRHEKIYTELLNRLPAAGVAEVSEEDLAYLESLMENDMFADVDVAMEKIKGKYTKDEALEIAEKVERDGIMYIYELQTLFPDLAPAEMKKILNEERRHLQAVLSRGMVDLVKYLRY
ncbi:MULTISPECIES: ferritin family protein [Anoxynatronum]|uniref:Rubrerythrin n=2 Tax=Anoxynatronum TaxID=210622 RepID=A0AA45WTU7_9CLOT|nr:ferritin family protein [Anoxynatronum buryatiense]SMP44771.1 Rubrerythrin [Anoxynatronum buryatiense]